MSFDFKQLTINDVTEALAPLAHIQRPDGDNDGDPINFSSVYDHLSEENQEKVDNARETTVGYILQLGQRAITEINKKGHRASYNPDQYSPDRNVGQVQVGDWLLDLSDQGGEDIEA